MDSPHMHTLRIVVNSVHPGWVDTPLLRSAGPMQGFYKCVRVQRARCPCFHHQALSFLMHSVKINPTTLHHTMPHHISG